MKRVLVLLLCLVLAVASFASCEQLGIGGEEHTHTFGDTWETDADYHWHMATCEHTDVKSSVGAHVDEDKNGECDICAYGDAHVHAYTDAWTTNETQHWHAATCGHSVKISVGNHVDADANGECDICAYGDAHIHTFTDAWTTDENNHWHAASCECESAKASEGAHVDADENGECDICGYGDAHIHTFTDVWASNETQHWHAASCEGHTDVKVAVGNHADANGDGYCDVCKYVMNEVSADHVHTFSDVWTADATGHWHAATCEHVDLKAVVSAHKDENVDSICDVCAYEITYEVTVNTSDNVTLSGETNGVYTVNNGETATFTASVASEYKLIAFGAAQVGDAVVADGVATYTFSVENVKANAEVAIVSTRTEYAKTLASGTNAMAFDGDSKWTVDVTVNLESADGCIILASVDEYDWSYTTDLTAVEGEDGKYCFSVYFYGSADTVESANASWIVLSVAADDDVVVYETEGSYVLPEGIDVNVTFVAPEAGIYAITTTSKDLLWNGNQYTYELPTAVAAEAGQAVSYSVKKESIETGTFEFNWKIEKVATSAAVLGDNDVTLEVGKYTVLEFTADKAGKYAFATSNYSDVKYWNAEYGYFNSMYFFDGRLDAGEKFVIFVANTDETVYTEGTFAEVVNVAYLGQEVDLEEGAVTVSASAEGESVVLIPTGVGTFSIVAADGVTMSFDGGKTWVSKYVAVFEANWDGSPSPESINAIFKAAEGETAVITVTELEVDVDVEVGGETTVTLLPGVTYNLNLAGLSESGSAWMGYQIQFILTWDNTDVVVSTDNNGEITSGVSASEYVGNSITMTVAEGAASYEVTLSLADANATELDELGALSILSYSTDVYKYFIPDATGYYLINVTGADTVVTVNGVDYESGEFAEIKLEAGEYVSIVVNASVNAEFTLAYLGAEKSEATEYNVVVAANGFYIISYTANANGKHTLSVADGETNALVKLVTITNNNGYGENYVSYAFGDTVIDASKTSYEFELGKGKTVYFAVSTIDGAADTVNLSAVLTEEATATEYVAEYDGNDAVAIAFTAEASGYYKFVLKQYDPTLGANVTLHEIGTRSYETILDIDLWGGEQISEVTIYIEAGVEYELRIQNYQYTAEVIIVTVEAV